MKINHIIREKRKQIGLTQENIAEYLGVSIPAVSKWENGTTYPDITLLPGLARLLKIDVNELLSFHEELSDIEIERLSKQIIHEIVHSGYVSAYRKAEMIMREYPNCNKLIYSLTQILQLHLSMQTDEIQEKYTKQIYSRFTVLAGCADSEIAELSLIMLCQKAIEDKDYEEAEQLIENYPHTSIDIRYIQANLYLSQNDYDRTYEIYQTLLFENANNLVNALTQLCQMKLTEQNYSDAHVLANLACLTAKSFELNDYIANTSKLLVAIELQDKKKTLEILAQMCSGLKHTPSHQSMLYSHLKFAQYDQYKEYTQITKTVLQQDKMLDFVRNNPEFQKILCEFEFEEKIE